MTNAAATKDAAAAFVYATFPNQTEAERIGGELVDRGLAACINIFPGMTSIYIWKGARQRDGEVAMVIKTRSALTERVIDEVKAMHRYENPALVVLPLAGGSAPFLAWIAEQTAKAG